MAKRSEETKAKQGIMLRSLWANPEWRARTLAARAAKGGAWNRGKKTGPQSAETLKKRSDAMRVEWSEPTRKAIRLQATIRGGETRRANGTPTYASVHLRMSYMAKRGQGPSGVCDCGAEGKEFALKNDAGQRLVDVATGLEFSPDIGDYVRMCVRCHRNYDNVGVKAWKTRLAHESEV